MGSEAGSPYTVAEELMSAGRVRVNGAILTTPACDVGPKDQVLVDGRPLPVVEPPRLWRYHKPAGLVTTRKDPGGRPTVYDALGDPERPARASSLVAASTDQKHDGTHGR